MTERAQFEINHPQPTTAEGLAHAAILSDAIGRIEDFQCLIFSQICGMNAAYEFGALYANSIQQVTRQTFRQATQLALRVPAKTSQPFFTAPQYVVYELDGKPFVLRVEQVLEWQAYRTALLKSNSPPQATVESFSIRKSILSVASQQLENLGHQFLNLASTLDSFSQLKVAGRDEPSMR